MHIWTFVFKYLPTHSHQMHKMMNKGVTPPWASFVQKRISPIQASPELNWVASSKICVATIQWNNKLFTAYPTPLQIHYKYIRNFPGPQILTDKNALPCPHQSSPNRQTLLFIRRTPIIISSFHHLQFLPCNQSSSQSDCNSSSSLPPNHFQESSTHQPRPQPVTTGGANAWF